MSEKKPSGGSAFPTAFVDNAPSFDLGMSLRDWFAGQALAGLGAVNELDRDEIAERAYALADAMLKARGEA